MEDIITLHKATCPSVQFDELNLQLSNDGVSESKSSNISLDVFSVKFENCRTIYPVRIIKAYKKGHIDPVQHMNYTINDIINNNCKITQFVGDNPKRSMARLCLCFSSWYPCEYCFAKGTKIVTNNAEITKKKNNIKVQKKNCSR